MNLIKNDRRKTESGYTLVELMMSLIIVGVLSIGLVLGMSAVMGKGKSPVDLAALDAKTIEMFGIKNISKVGKTEILKSDEKGNPINMVITNEYTVQLTYENSYGKISYYDPTEQIKEISLENSE